MPLPLHTLQATEITMNVQLGRHLTCEDTTRSNTAAVSLQVVVPEVRPIEVPTRIRLQETPSRIFGQPRQTSQNAAANLNKVYRFINIERDVDGYGHRVVELAHPQVVAEDIRFIEQQMRETEPVVFRMDNYKKPDFVERKSKNKDESKTVEKPKEETEEPASKKSMTRLDFEARELTGKMIDGIVGGLGTTKKKTHWNFVVEGPSGSVYEGSRFFGYLTLDEKYPTVAPLIKFTSVIFHPNVSSEGVLDNRQLVKNWNAEMGIKDCYNFIRDQLTNVMHLEKNRFPVQPEITDLVLNKPDEFVKCARLASRLYTKC